ncbi:hypothetical protein N431DRAFT_441578 [Stipitochalara longipes BDJ]|nr:hypothetical protein N431DRAFT_441578 [Stipitochalara longipes BDJ]
MPSQHPAKRRAVSLPPFPRPGGPLDLFIQFCYLFILFTNKRPVDLESCLALKGEVYVIIGRWLEGAEHPAIGFNRGQNYGNVIQRILEENGMDRQVVIVTARWQKHLIEV